MGAPADLSLLLDRVARLAGAAGQDGRRRVLGVAGPPGAGKTTLVEALLAAAAADRRLTGRLAHVPMDGFHLSNAALEELDLRGRKGAPDTFDTASYAAVLAAVRDSPRRVVTAPAFDHAVGEPTVDALVVPVAADVVVTEGNYLLLDEPAWQPVRATLDEVWFCALADEVRRARLVQRHVAAGRDPHDAKAWVERSDEANARLVSATAARADLALLDGRVLGGSAAP
ncbi:MAG TPA: nucleoside/nucleotide kinase family protein [Pedococcus sp.]